MSTTIITVTGTITRLTTAGGTVINLTTGGSGVPQVQSDWDQDDDAEKDSIKNKPDDEHKLDTIIETDQSVVSNVDFLGQVKGGVITDTFSATKIFDMDNGNVQKMLVTSNLTSLSLSNKVAGSSYCIILKISGSGNYSIPQPDSTFGTRTDNSVDDSEENWYPTTVGSKIIYSIIVDAENETFYSIETITI
jgi:hypothetical protein